MKRFLMIIPFVKMAMLVGLVVFHLFWYVPSMRKQSRYRQEMDSVFNQAMSCKDKAWAQERWDLTRACFANWDTWQEAHDVPRLGWDWPWAN